ncbi:MAG: hypothetical protein WBA51_16980 [Erythrobacter sp.]
MTFQKAARSSPGWAKGAITGPVYCVVLTLAGCSDQASDESPDQSAGGDISSPGTMTSNWDGTTKDETDAIVTLKLSEKPTGVLVNGEPAKVNVGFGEVQVLIEADDSGISCTNTYIVSFADGAKGQLLANHCHGDDAFTVKSGEISERLVSKEDVDGSDIDDPEDGTPTSQPGESLAVGWSANGFEQLPARYQWAAGSAGNPFFGLGVPETDDSIWASFCENGKLVNDIYISDDKLGKGAVSSLKVETDAGPMQTYSVSAQENAFGYGYRFVGDPGTGPLKQMVSGDWLYLQMGEGDGATKLRISLDGAAAKARAMLDAC